MNWCPTPPEKKVRATLALHGRKLTETGPGRWQLELGNGKPFTVRARVQGPWLTFDAHPSPGRAEVDPWQILLEARDLQSVARTVMDPRTGDLGIRSEVLLHDRVALPERVGAACLALVHVASSQGAPGSPQEEPAQRSPKSLGDRLGETLTREGWDWEEREDGSLSVTPEELVGPRCRFTPGPNDGFIVRLGLQSGPSGSTGQRRALGILLLTGAGLLRWVQAYADADPEVDRVGLGIVLHQEPVASELTHALSALSLAAVRLRSTALALSVPAVAERYLQVRRWGPRTAVAKREAGRESKGQGKRGRERRSGVETARTYSQGGEG